MLVLLLLLCLMGYGLGRRRWQRLPWVFYGVAFGLFLAASCGPLPAWLLAHLQAPYAEEPRVDWASRNAIVLLGVGTSRIAGSKQVVPMMLAGGRMVEAYTLYRACKQSGHDCKLVISGGDPVRNGLSEAAAYAGPLLAMGVDRADLLLESRSLNTWQNAQFVQPLLSAYAPQRVVLVSSAIHLARAQTYFAHFGIDTLAVRGDYADVRLTWLPNAWNLTLTDSALHEYLGLQTYRLYNAMGWNAPPPSRYGAP